MDYTKIKIEKNVPIPKKGGNNKYPIAEMNVGDSLFFPVGFFTKRDGSDYEKREYTQRVNAVFSSIKRQNKEIKKWAFTCRTTKEGVRVWRIE